MEIPHRAQNQICTGTKPETHSPCSYLGVCLKDRALSASCGRVPFTPSCSPQLSPSSTHCQFVLDHAGRSSDRAGGVMLHYLGELSQVPLHELQSF